MRAPLIRASKQAPTCYVCTLAPTSLLVQPEFRSDQETGLQGLLMVAYRHIKWGPWIPGTLKLNSISSSWYLRWTLRLPSATSEEAGFGPDPLGVALDWEICKVNIKTVETTWYTVLLAIAGFAESHQLPLPFSQLGRLIWNEKPNLKDSGWSDRNDLNKSF